ncbi:hypothetical protein Tco_1184379 [Tanacetum coccineum]
MQLLGENSRTQVVVWQKPPSYTKGEPLSMVTKGKEPKFAEDNKGKGIARDTDESLRKLVPASKEIHPDPDTLMLIPYEINGKLYQLTNEQIQAHLEKEEKLERAAQEAKLIELNKPVMIKVVKEVVIEVGVDPIDESLSKNYDRLKVIPIELGISPTLPPLKLTHSLSSCRKRKALELKPEVCIAGLECNRSLPKRIPFAFQKVSDIHKVEVKTLLGYLVMAGNVNAPKNQRFCVLLRQMIDAHPDREKLKSKKVKLEGNEYLFK